MTTIRIRIGCIVGVTALLSGCATAGGGTASGVSGAALASPAVARASVASPSVTPSAEASATPSATRTSHPASSSPTRSTRGASDPIIAVIAEPPGTGPLYLAAGAGRIWVDDHSSFDASVIDPATDTVASLDIPTQGGVQFFEGNLWAASYNAGTMTRMDPATMKVTGTVHVPEAGGLVRVDNSVYVYHGGSLTALDLDTLKTGETFDIGGSCWGLTVVGAAIWCGGGPDGEVVWRYDLKSRQITDHWDVGHYGILILLDDTIWATGRGSPDLLQIDVATKRIRKVPLGGTPGGLFDAYGSVWLTDFDAGTIRRLDRKTAALGPAVALGFTGLGPPFAAFDSVWVSSFERDAVLRIDPARVPTH
jgi:streptogramin lyase